MKLLGTGLYWDELSVGDTFRTYGRTITEADIAAFVALTGMMESLFIDHEYRKAHSVFSGTPAPGALVFAMADALVLNASGQATGLAFLNMEFDVKGPTLAGDTIHVEFEVTEVRATSKGRGLVRTSNRIVNQRGEVVLTYTPLRLMAGTGSHAAEA